MRTGEAIGGRSWWEVEEEEGAGGRRSGKQILTNFREVHTKEKHTHKGGKR